MTDTLITGTFNSLQDSWFPPDPLGNIRPEASFFVVPIAVAKRIREAMGREHNRLQGKGANLGVFDTVGPGKQGPVNRRGTFWLEDFKVNRDGTEAAFRDTPALRAMVGKTLPAPGDGADIPKKPTILK